MGFPAAVQNTRDPSPSQRHTIPRRSTRKGRSHENARGPTLAGRAQPEARDRAKALSLPPRTLGAPARQAAAVGPSVPNPSIPRGHPSTLAHIRG